MTPVDPATIVARAAQVAHNLETAQETRVLVARGECSPTWAKIHNDAWREACVESAADVPALLASVAALTAERDAARADVAEARGERTALREQMQELRAAARLVLTLLEVYDPDDEEQQAEFNTACRELDALLSRDLTAERDAALARATAAEARGAVVRAEGCYILSLRWSRGDALVWWRPYGAGYTLRLDGAGVYSAEEAGAICRPSPKEVVAVPVALAHAECSRVVLDGARHRLLGAVEAALAATGGAR